MRTRKTWVLTVLIAGCSMLSTGCLDVFVDGAVRGVNISVQTVVQDIIAGLVDRAVNPPVE